MRFKYIYMSGRLLTGLTQTLYIYIYIGFGSNPSMGNPTQFLTLVIIRRQKFLYLPQLSYFVVVHEFPSVHSLSTRKGS